jgi:protein-S-isoprenylcysteine O-methyltransferase Ste14
MGGFLSLIYGVAVYLFFVCTFLYAIAFAGNLWVPKTIDSGTPGPVGEALIVNLALLGLFAVQHSVMARRSFKRWWTTIVPAAIERSTYVLAATAALALLLWQWRPMPALVWTVTDPLAVKLIWALFWLGWGVLFLATFLINHFELFGLHQVFARLIGREIPATEFRTPFLYRYVRHPIYLGFLMAFWSAPVMSQGRFLFAAGATGYILIGIWFEERDLIHHFGDTYRRYKEQVGMLIPWRSAR